MAQAVGGAESARPVAGDPGISSLVAAEMPEYRVLRDYAEPGATRRMHKHPDATWHVFTLITGKLSLTVEGEAPVEVAPGQVVTLKGGVNHTFKNIGAVTATIVEVFGKSKSPVQTADNAALNRQIEAFMDDYLRLWNAHDAAAITARVYRLDGNHPWRSKEGLQAEFDRLKAQGYDKSDIASVIGCATSDDAGQVELRFTRLKTDGTFMPPKDRVSLYQVKRFAEGWRVTGMKALGAGERMQCSQ